MKEMNVLTLNGEQYEIADKEIRNNAILKENIPPATEEDTLQIHVKPDGTLWVNPSSIMPPTPPVKPGKTYTVKIQLNNNNPETACTYTDDAAGMTPGYIGWKDTELFKSIKPCVVKDGIFQYYLDKNNLSKKETGEPVDIASVSTGDIMVEIPKIGYRMWKDSDYQYISITESTNKNSYCYLAHSLETEGDCDKIYIGAFQGWNFENKMYSIAGKKPARTIALSDSRNYTQSKGNGYQLLSFYPLTLLQCLYLIEYKNRNSKEAIGYGYFGSSIHETGGTITKGPDFGDSNKNNQMCFMNIEDFWGNSLIWVDGIYYDNSMNIKTDFHNFNDNGANYTYITNSNISSDIEGYLKEIQGNNTSGFIASIADYSASPSTYYCDYSSLFRGSVGYFGDTGAFRFGCNVKATPGKNDIGCRIIFKHMGK